MGQKQTHVLQQKQSIDHLVCGHLETRRRAEAERRTTRCNQDVIVRSEKFYLGCLIWWLPAVQESQASDQR